MWNVILDKVEGNMIVQSKNNPKESGEYVCTCISKAYQRDEFKRYIRIMQYDAIKNYWHDIGNKSGISHTILAWKSEEPCDFKDFIYNAGILLECEKPVKSEETEGKCIHCGTDTKDENLKVCDKCAGQYKF